MSMRKVEFFRHDLGQAELESFQKTLSSLFLTSGPRVIEFEQMLGQYLGVPHVVGVSSCTAGLHLALLALGVGPGDEVITTPMTYIATSNSVMYAGAQPVFVDVQKSNALIDPDAVEAAITPKTRGIIAVHLYGQMADMRRLRQIADRHGLWLMEDSAHGIEMRRDGLAPGQLSDTAVFSFYATKTIACGDGGAIAVRDPALAERLKRLRSHGVSKDAASRYGSTYQHWDMVELGFKANMTDIDASLLIPQMARVDKRRELREQAVVRYRERLSGAPNTEFIDVTGTSSHHLFTVLAPPGQRDEVLSGLGARGVGVAVNYRAVHLLTYYRERFGFRPGMFPAAEEIGARTVSLPLYPGLSADDIDYVVAQYRELVAGR